MQDAEHADDVIARVGAHPSVADRVVIRTEGGAEFELALDLAVEAGLGAGSTLTGTARAELMARDHLLRARDTALRYLSDQSRTVTEVRRALRRRGFAPDAVEHAVDYVAAQGYVNDAEYARAYVRSRFASRGHGPSRLRDELMRRGVDRAIIEEALSELGSSDDLAGAALALAETRYRALATERDPRRRRQRTLEWLVRRGYSFDDAREAVERVAAGDGPAEDAE